jgi:hypothetical protein
MKDAVIKAILGPEAKRPADVSILCDEQEGETVWARDDAAREAPLFESKTNAPRLKRAC